MKSTKRGSEGQAHSLLNRERADAVERDFDAWLPKMPNAHS
jgi:hypothetical protein